MGLHKGFVFGGASVLLVWVVLRVLVEDIDAWGSLWLLQLHVICTNCRRPVLHTRRIVLRNLSTRRINHHIRIGLRRLLLLLLGNPWGSGSWIGLLPQRGGRVVRFVLLIQILVFVLEKVYFWHLLRLLRVRVYYYGSVRDSVMILKFFSQHLIFLSLLPEIVLEILKDLWEFVASIFKSCFSRFCVKNWVRFLLLGKSGCSTCMRTMISLQPLLVIIEFHRI